MKNAREFWARVSLRKPYECWPWQGKVTKSGYGIAELSGIRGAHRVSFFLSRNVDPEKLFVCHKCDNPPCCNPAHLFLGEARDNSRDMVEKGRQFKGERASIIAKEAKMRAAGPPTVESQRILERTRLVQSKLDSGMPVWRVASQLGMTEKNVRWYSRQVDPYRRARVGGKR